MHYKNLQLIYHRTIHLNHNHLTQTAAYIDSQNLAALVNIIDEGKVNFSVASTKILPMMIIQNKSALQVAEELNLLQVSNSNDLEDWVNTVLANMPDKVAEYKKGKKGLIGLFVGEVKKISQGKADPKIVTELLTKKLTTD